MRVLIAHNRYQQRGGEDVVVENELRLLASAGHEVRKLILSNDTIASPLDKLLTLLRTASNPAGVAAMKGAVAAFHPDLVHVHNFFPLLSPAIYRVCRQLGIPVVQTLHNYRPFCANARLLRQGKICQLCVKGSPYLGALHRCYRGSLPGSLGAARMIDVHRRRGTWLRDVDRYIAMTEFGRGVFIKAGFPGGLIDVKPNFADDPGPPIEKTPRKGVLYVGRLSGEKGVDHLIEACARHGYPLRIAGGGPEAARLKATASDSTVFLGEVTHDAVLDEMRRASVLVLPSIWYESFPMVIVEAFANATPVIVSGLGALGEIVEDGATGYHVPPANAEALGARIGELLANPARARELGHAARRTFTERYTPEANLRMLDFIYHKALEGNSGSRKQGQRSGGRS